MSLTPFFVTSFFANHSMTKIQRGFFRLWLVLTAIWLVIVAFCFSVPSAIEQAASGLPPAPSEPRPEHTVTSSRGANSFDDIDRSIEEALARADAMHSDKPNPTKDWANWDEAVEKRNGALADLKSFVILGSAIPVGLLVFGLSLAWVWRGFTKPI